MLQGVEHFVHLDTVDVWCDSQIIVIMMDDIWKKKIIIFDLCYLDLSLQKNDIK